MYEMVVQPVRHCRATSRPACAPGTSTRSTKCRIRAGSRTGSARRRSRRRGDRARPECRRPARSVELGDHPRENRGHPSRVHRHGREGRDLVSRVRSPSQSRRRHGGRRDRHEDLLGARLQPGRDVPHDVRSEAGRDRPEGDGPAAIRRAHALHARRHQRDPRTGRAQRRRHVSRHRRPADPGQDPRRLPATPARGPTIPTTSCRTNTGASCARCACSAPGPTSPTSRPRTRSTRSSTENGRADREALPAGCRARRSACATTSTNGIRAGSISTRATPSTKRLLLVRFCAEPVADGALRRYPSIGKFEGDVFDPRPGGRRRRPRPTWSCATTMRSGRRGAWWRSPTS